MGERRKRIPPARRDELIKFLYRLPIEFDFEANERIVTEIVKLAVRYRLTMYDATYLELAARREMPLATLDEDLGAAAKKERLEVWGK